MGMSLASYLLRFSSDFEAAKRPPIEELYAEIMQIAERLLVTWSQRSTAMTLPSNFGACLRVYEL